jgi:hypothetical protein
MVRPGHREYQTCPLNSAHLAQADRHKRIRKQHNAYIAAPKKNYPVAGGWFLPLPVSSKRVRRPRASRFVCSLSG